MVAGLYSLIPGLKDAEDQYLQDSQEAFAGVEPRIAGRIEVKPFTPRMFLELDGSGNRFFQSTGELGDEDIAAFLWRVSPVYKRDAPEDQDVFSSLMSFVLLESRSEFLSAGIYQYISRAWSGMPLFKGGTSDNVSTWASHLVHMLAKEYGWSEEYILDLPFRRLWQYVNRIMEDANPKYKERCAKALHLRQQWLIEQNK